MGSEPQPDSESEQREDRSTSIPTPADDDVQAMARVELAKKKLVKARRRKFVGVLLCAIFAWTFIPIVIGISLLREMDDINAQIKALDTYGAAVLDDRNNVDMEQVVELSDGEDDGIDLPPQATEAQIAAAEKGWISVDPTASWWTKPFTQLWRERRERKRLDD